MTNFPKILSPKKGKLRALRNRLDTSNYTPTKPTKLRGLSNTTPRKRHVVARGSGAYIATAKELKGNTTGTQKQKALSAKRMLQHYMRSVEHVPISVQQVGDCFRVIKEPRSSHR